MTNLARQKLSGVSRHRLPIVAMIPKPGMTEEPTRSASWDHFLMRWLRVALQFAYRASFARLKPQMLESIMGICDDDPMAIVRRIESKIDSLGELLKFRQKPLLTVEEFAANVGRTPYTVRRWIADGRIRATRVQGTGPRGKLLIARDELQGLLAAGLAGEVPPTALQSSTIHSISPTA